MDNNTQPTVPQTTLEQPTQHPFWQHVSKRTLLLIVILLAITSGLLYLAIRQEQPQPKIGEPLTQAPAPSPAHATLSLVQQPASTSALHTVSVMVAANGNKITGAQLNLAYDPKVLSNVTIKSGTFFQNPTVLFNTVDKVNGRISYVLAISPNGEEATGSGTVATISYTLLPTLNATTAISFLPKTGLTQQGILGSVLKTSTDLIIQIPKNLQTPGVATPASSAAK